MYRVIKFKVGDKVIRVDPYGGADEIKLGAVYKLDDVDEYGYVYIYNKNNEWLDQCRFVHAGQQTLENAFDKAVEQVGATVVAKSLIEKETQMTAEQLREEIIRIDTRIEEAKKDIENAQTERSSLVEKLREKGFEMVTSRTADGGYAEVTVDNVKAGDVLIMVAGSWNADIDEGDQVVVVANDKSGIPFKVKSTTTGREDWAKSDTVAFK
jgi:hypothetical protein